MTTTKKTMIIESAIYDIAKFAADESEGRRNLQYISFYPEERACMATNGHFAIVVHRDAGGVHSFFGKAKDQTPVLVGADVLTEVMKGGFSPSKQRVITLDFEVHEGNFIKSKLEAHDTSLRFSKKFDLEQTNDLRPPNLAQVWPTDHDLHTDPVWLQTKYLKLIVDYAAKAQGKTGKLDMMMGGRLAPVQFDLKVPILGNADRDGYITYASVVLMPANKKKA